VTAWLAGAALVSLVLVPGDRLYSAASKDILAYDFRQTFLPAAEALLDGSSPYPEYGYPPLVAFLSIPFALVPSPELWLTGLLIGLLPLSLWLLGVRDWRCYAAALLWIPVFNAVQTANVTLPILVAAAICWRYRDSARVVALAGGLGVAAKIVAWPLLVWLAATRRVRAALGVVAVAAGVTLGLWATIAFSGLLSYPDSLGDLEEAQGERGYTFSALAADAGLPESLGAAVGLFVALLVLAGAVLYGRGGDDRRSFACALTAAVIASPVIWLHSFALLLGPVAVLRPRLSWVWFVPAALWLTSEGTGNGAPWQTALTLAAALLILLVVLRDPVVGRAARPSPIRPAVGDPA
jgi:Glycosyltransferase family 87